MQHSVSRSGHDGWARCAQQAGTHSPNLLASSLLMWGMRDTQCSSLMDGCRRFTLDRKSAATEVSLQRSRCASDARMLPLVHVVTSTCTAAARRDRTATKELWSAATAARTSSPDSIGLCAASGCSKVPARTPQQQRHRRRTAQLIVPNVPGESRSRPIQWAPPAPPALALST